MPLFLTFQNCLSVLNQEYIINDYVLEKSRSLNTEEFFSRVEFYMWHHILYGVRLHDFKIFPCQ